MYVVTFKNKIVWDFDDKEEFINETIKNFHETVSMYGLEGDAEAKELGFTLSEYKEIAEDVWEGGEIIIDDAAFQACVNYWESGLGGSKGKVFEAERAFPKAEWRWKEEPDYYMDPETGTYSWEDEDAAVYVDSGGSWEADEAIDLTEVYMLHDLVHHDDFEVYYKDKPLDDWLCGEYNGKDLFDDDEDEDE